MDRIPWSLRCWLTKFIRMAARNWCAACCSRVFPSRPFKDIVAASDENYVFDLIDSNAPFALVGAGSFTTTSSVIAPAVLFEELELEPIKEETPKPPIVPPPSLTGQSALPRASTSSAAAGRTRARQRQLSMGLLFRAIFREVAKSAIFGAVLFTFVLFLQGVGKLFEILVRSSAPPATVAHLFALAIPFTLSFTMPLGVLVGVLIALSRMSSDGEIIALRAAGVPSRKVIPPVLLFATLAMLVTATASLWLTPYSTWRTYKVLNQLVAAELTSEVQPQVFNEDFPNRVRLYQRRGSGRDESLAQRFYRRHHAGGGTEEDRSRSRRRPHRHGSRPRHRRPGCAAQSDPAFSAEWRYLRRRKRSHRLLHLPQAPTGAQILEATKPNEVHAKGYTEIDTLPLYRLAYHDKKLDHDNVIQARIELHQRLALPPACFLLALIGIPLGHLLTQGRQIGSIRHHGGAGVHLLDGVDRGPTAGPNSRSFRWASRCGFPTPFSPWSACSCDAHGAARRSRLDCHLTGWATAAWTALRGKLPAAAAHVRSRSRGWRMFLVPQVVDRYVLQSFLFWFALLLIGFVLMTHVYEFFDLLSDIVKNHIAMSRVFTYLFFLTPQIIFDSAPMSVLVAVLITFGILTKHNEITAMKASGISLYRLARPGARGGAINERRLIRFRALLRAGRQSQAGRHSERDQRQAGADVLASGPELGLRSRIEQRSEGFLFQVY